MDKEDKDSMKIIVIILIVLSALVFVSYNHFHSTEEEQAQKAVLKLQKAFKEKMQDELIQMATRLEQNQDKQRQKKKVQSDVPETEKPKAHHDLASLNEVDQKKSNTLVDMEHKTYDNPNHNSDSSKNNSQSKEESSEDSNGVSAFGITIGKTTRDEIVSNFSVVKEVSIVQSEEHKKLILNEKDFSSENLPVQEVGVILDQHKVVVQLAIIFSGSHFHKLDEVLSQKYKQIVKQDPFVGDHKALYVKNNNIIILMQPHMGRFVTQLAYFTKDFEELCSAYNKMRAKQEKNRMLGQL